MQNRGLKRWSAALTLAGAALVACGGGSAPAGPTPSGDLVASGTVTDRIAGAQIDGSTITFTGPATRSGTVTNGTYRVDGLSSGLYTVTIDGPRHVQHKTLGVGVYASASSTFSFEVLAWGAGRFGVTYDETFHRFFHQPARVRGSGPSAIGKWASPPSELYLVEGTIPSEQFAGLQNVAGLAPPDLKSAAAGASVISSRRRERPGTSDSCGWPVP